MIESSGGVGRVVFGSATGPSTDGLTACEFDGDDYASDRLSSSAMTLSAGPRTLVCWARLTGLPTIDPFVLAACPFMSLQVSLAGLILGDSTTGPSINDGAGHHLALVRNGVTEVLYVDGVQVHSVAAGTPAAGTGMFVGFLEGSMAHVAVFDAALTAAQIAAQADVVLTGAAGERTDERLLRVLGWAGVSPAEVDAEVGVETMTYQLTSGQTATDVLRECESTEGGVLFDGPDGNVKFHNRSHRYLATAAATLNMTSQHVGADYAPRLDRSALVNDVTVSNPTTDESARAVDGTSSAEYGIATTSASSVAESYAPLQEKAGWLLALYAEPRMRCPSLTVDVLAHQGLTPSAQTLLGVTVGDLLAVTNAPTQSDTTTPTYFVEGYTETIGPERYEITYNLSPTYPTLNTFVLDSATRGVLDTSILAY